MEEALHVDHADFIWPQMHYGVTEMSSLGLRPGFYPRHILLLHGQEDFKYRFERAEYSANEDLVAVIYVNEWGSSELHLLND